MPLPLPYPVAVAGGIALKNSSSSLTGMTVVENGVETEGRVDVAGGIAIADGSHLVQSNTIVAFSTSGTAVWVDGLSSASLICCDVYGNEGGDWVGYIADQADINGNLRSNPLFCSDLNPEEPLTIASHSPCAPEYNPDCGLIGALPVGCVVTAVDDGVPAPVVNRLYQSYPNPFNPSTTISFDLPESQPVRLAIYTVDGKRVTLLIGTVMPAGKHEITWNGRDLQGRRVTSGIYFYRLETGSFIETKRMVLVK